MTLSITLGLIGFAGMIYGAIRSDDKQGWGRYSIADYIPLGIIGAVIGMLIGFCVSGVITISAPASCLYPKETLLQSLATGSGLNGSFFLGSGFVNQQLVYYYIRKESDHGYTLNSINANQAEVYERGDESPHMTEFTPVIDFPWDLVSFSPSNRFCLTNFVVPPGSVNNTYKVG